MKCFMLFAIGTCVWAAPVPVHRHEAETEGTESILYIDGLLEGILNEDNLPETTQDTDDLPEDSVNEDDLPEDSVNEDDLPEDNVNEDDLPDDSVNEDELSEVTQNLNDFEVGDESDIRESDETDSLASAQEESGERNENAIPEEEEFQDFVNDDETESDVSYDDVDADIAEQLADESQAGVTAKSAGKRPLKDENSRKSRTGRFREKQKANALDGKEAIRTNEDDQKDVTAQTEEDDTTTNTGDESVVSADDEETEARTTDEQRLRETGDQLDAGERTRESGDADAEEADEEEDAAPPEDKDQEIPGKEDKSYTTDTKEATSGKAGGVKAESRANGSIDKTKVGKTISIVRDFIFVKAKDSVKKRHNFMVGKLRLLRMLKDKRLSRIQHM